MKTILALGAAVVGLATVVSAKPLAMPDAAKARGPAAAVGTATAGAPATPSPAPLVAHEVGRIAAAFVVHPENPVPYLSLEQIRDILSGAVRVWSEVGGPDMPIVVVAQASGSAPRRMVEESLFGGDGLAPASLEVVRDAERVAAVVSQRPDAIGIVSAEPVRHGLRRMASDAVIEEPILMVTRGAPSPAGTRVIEAVRTAAAR